MSGPISEPTSFLDTLRSVGVLAVIRAASVDVPIAMSHALVRGGVLGIEITFSTPGTLDGLARAELLV